jgi:alkylhydroperoxidase/carboxymuconolactone decarboxylase family protein YurZ
MDHEETLRRLTVRDEEFVESILAHERNNRQASALDPKTHALVRIAALVTIDAAPASYLWTIESALKFGATSEEIVGVLVAVMPSIGSARVVAAAPKLGLALGYDVYDELERPPAPDELPET